MTLRDLPLPITISEAVKYCLVFTPALAERLGELHAAHGSTNCVPTPQLLTDGRLMLSADVLTEIEPGGMLHAMWLAADKDRLLDSVAVMRAEDATSLLQPPPAS